MITQRHNPAYRPAAEGTIPEQCPVCKAPASAFVEKTGNTYVTEHVVGIGKAEGVPQEIVDGLRANFEGECRPLKKNKPNGG